MYKCTRNIIYRKIYWSKRLKNTVIVALIIKFINVILICFLNHSGLNNIINICIAIDLVMEYIVITSIYPLITTIKSNTLYSKESLLSIYLEI